VHFQILNAQLQHAHKSNIAVEAFLKLKSLAKGRSHGRFPPVMETPTVESSSGSPNLLAAKTTEIQ
jgi:hypothetical protein